MLNFENQIVLLECYPKVGEEVDVVCIVHWRIVGKQEIDEKNYVYSTFGSFSLKWEEGEPFTPYEELTSDQVWSWVENNVDVDQQQEIITKAINDMINPPIITLPLPWNTNGQDTV